VATLILDTPEGLRQARADRIGGIHAVLARHDVAVDPVRVGEAYDAVGTKLEGFGRPGEMWGRRDSAPTSGESGLEERVPREGPLMDALDDAYCHPSSRSCLWPTKGPRRS